MNPCGCIPIKFYVQKWAPGSVGQPHLLKTILPCLAILWKWDCAYEALLTWAGQCCLPVTQWFPGSTGQVASWQPQDKRGGWLAGESRWSGRSGSSGQEALGKRFGIDPAELLLPSGLSGHQFLKPDVSELKPQEGVSHGYWLCWEEISLKEMRRKTQSWIINESAWEQT